LVGISAPVFVGAWHPVYAAFLNFLLCAAGKTAFSLLACAGLRPPASPFFILNSKIRV
jgi:hypothetical protein